MNILVVGFGNMGFRHTQSILNGIENAKVYVIESSIETYKANMERIGAQNQNVTLLSRIEDASLTFDFCVIATSAQPRFEIMKNLLEKGIKNFLLEKVVFQSKNQFDIIIDLLHKYDARAYCNFVQRYYTNYQIYKESLSNTPIKMSVLGGDFGLACNALHYVDLFEYLTGSQPILVSSKLTKSEMENKRGRQYREVFGAILYITSKGDMLSIISDEKFRDMEVCLSQEGSNLFINESWKTTYTVSVDNGISIGVFNPIYTSSLTSRIVTDVLDGNCILPTVQRTSDIHVALFEVINEALGLDSSEICPIT
jgi:hypothetical protein